VREVDHSVPSRLELRSVAIQYIPSVAIQCIPSVAISISLVLPYMSSWRGLEQLYLSAFNFTQINVAARFN